MHSTDLHHANLSSATGFRKDQIRSCRDDRVRRVRRFVQATQRGRDDRRVHLSSQDHLLIRTSQPPMVRTTTPTGRAAGPPGAYEGQLLGAARVRDRCGSGIQAIRPPRCQDHTIEVVPFGRSGEPVGWPFTGWMDEARTLSHLGASAVTSRLSPVRATLPELTVPRRRRV